MSVVPAETVVSQLRWRYATKKFDSTRRIPEPVWASLEQSLVLSPSSYGLQPYRFIVVGDPKLRATLLPLSWGQAQVTDASHFIVFAARNDLTEADVDRFLARTAEVRGGAVDALSPYRKMMVGDLVQGPRHAWIKHWSARQVYIALGNLMTCAALIGIDTCPMEGIDPARYDEALGLQARGYSTVCACALGYRATDDKYAGMKKIRFSAADLIERR